MGCVSFSYHYNLRITVVLRDRSREFWSRSRSRSRGLWSRSRSWSWSFWSRSRSRRFWSR